MKILEGIGNQLLGNLRVWLTLAVLFALMLTVPALVRPQRAGAQTVCNGSFDPFNMGCSSALGNYCNGTFGFGNGCLTASTNACNGPLGYSNLGCSTNYGVGCTTSTGMLVAGCSAGSFNCNSFGSTSVAGCSTAFGCNVVGFNSTNCG